MQNEATAKLSLTLGCAIPHKLVLRGTVSLMSAIKCFKHF